MKTKNKHQHARGEVTELARETAKVEQYWIVGDRSEPPKPPEELQLRRGTHTPPNRTDQVAGVCEAQPSQDVRHLRGAGCSGQGWRHQAHYRSAEPPRLPRRRSRDSDPEGARAVVFPAICSGIALAR